jgi:Protein of unknown function (DUF3455)
MKRSSRTSAGQRFRLSVTVVVMGLLAVTLAAPAVGGQGQGKGLTPDLDGCQNLAVRSGNKVFFRVYAEGVQIYRWNGTSWGFVAPEADLFANPGGTGLIGVHYAGPTWESVSGSKVVGAALERCTPDPDDIPWLLLRAVSSEGPGPFAKVTYIQRVNTSGGIAPTQAGAIGDEARVPYTTEYYFYREHP